MNLHTYLTFEHLTGLTITCALSWTDNDPFVITLRFGGDHPAIWYVDRDLIFLGLADRAGLGDVRVARVSPTWVRFTFDSPNGHCELHASAWAVGNFLARTFDQVPRGSEMDRVDVDAELAELLGEAA